MTYKANRWSRQWILLVSLVLEMASIPALGGVAVIVNPDNATVSMTASQVKAIFLKKTKKFPDGDSATPIDQEEHSEIYTQFAKKVLSKDAAQLKSYWSLEIFSGRGSPPEQLDGDEQVKAQISSLIHAIGYIDSDSVDDSVKVVFRVD